MTMPRKQTRQPQTILCTTRVARSACLLVLATHLLSACSPPGPTDAERRVDAIFEQWDSAESPGCAVAVARDGLTVLERAYGMADLEHGIPNTPNTIFEGGSLAKQFTSAAVVMLATRGDLSLDDDVRKYVPEVPDYGYTITLRHLMTHTSGLRDWGSVASISGWDREYRTHNHDHVLDIVSRQTALNFVPGDEYSYSNTGFNLLAIVVDRVSGMSFAEFSRVHLFEPLGMKDTEWRDDYRRIVKRRSTAYTALDDGRFEINRPIEDVHGNGGILTTVADLLTWTQNLADGRVGGREFLRLMHERGSLNDGSTIQYAAGLFVQEFAGVPSVTHTGSTAGYRAFLGRYPGQSLAVAMLCNVTNVPTAGTGGLLARVYLGDDAADPVPAAGIDMPAEALSKYAGLYVEPVTGSAMEWRVESGELRAGDMRLVPVSATTFVDASGGVQMVFEDVRRGNRAAYSLKSWQHTQRYEPVEPWSPSESELQELAGIYKSDDAETTFVASVVNGELALWRRPNETLMLAPAYRDGFRSDYNTVRFRRDDSGKVTGFSLSRSRVFDMRFDRVDSL